MPYSALRPIAVLLATALAAAVEVPLFTAPQVTDAGTNARHLQMADLNGDGRQDLLLCDQADNALHVRYGRGDGSFGPAHAIGGAITAPAMSITADLALDGGEPDVLVVSGGSIVLLRNTANVITVDGTITGDSSYPVQDVAVADLDGDGNTEVVATGDHATLADRVSISELTGFSPGAPSNLDLAVGSNPIGLLLQDINGDGSIDILVACAGSGQVAVLLNDQLGGFAPPAYYTASTGTRQIVWLDTGRLLAVNAANLSGLEILAGGILSPPQTFAVDPAQQSRNARLADLDLDGDQDLILSYLSTTRVDGLPNGGNWAFSWTDAATNTLVAGLPGGTQRSMRLADIDADGRQDVIALTNTGSTTVGRVAVALSAQPRLLYPQAGLTVPSGQRLPIIVDAQDVAGSPVTQVQFERSTDGGLSWSPIGSMSDADFANWGRYQGWSTIDQPTANTRYRAQVTVGGQTYSSNTVDVAVSNPSYLRGARRLRPLSGDTAADPKALAAGGGWAVGVSGGPAGERAVRWDLTNSGHVDGEAIPVTAVGAGFQPGDTLAGSVALGVDDSGRVIGLAYIEKTATPTYTVRGWVWEETMPAVAPLQANPLADDVPEDGDIPDWAPMRGDGLAGFQEVVSGLYYARLKTWGQPVVDLHSTILAAEESTVHCLTAGGFMGGAVKRAGIVDPWVQLGDGQAILFASRPSRLRPDFIDGWAQALLAGGEGVLCWAEWAYGDGAEPVVSRLRRSNGDSVAVSAPQGVANAMKVEMAGMAGTREMVGTASLARLYNQHAVTATASGSGGSATVSTPTLLAWQVAPATWSAIAVDAGASGGSTASLDTARGISADGTRILCRGNANNVDIAVLVGPAPPTIASQTGVVIAWPAAGAQLPAGHGFHTGVTITGLPMGGAITSVSYEVTLPSASADERTVTTPWGSHWVANWTAGASTGSASVVATVTYDDGSTDTASSTFTIVAAPAATHEIAALPTPAAADEVRVDALSANGGHACGWWKPTSGSTLWRQAIAWSSVDTTPTATAIDVSAIIPDGLVASWARDINDSGDLVGFAMSNARDEIVLGIDLDGDGILGRLVDIHLWARIGGTLRYIEKTQADYDDADDEDIVDWFAIGNNGRIVGQVGLPDAPTPYSWVWGGSSFTATDLTNAIAAGTGSTVAAASAEASSPDGQLYGGGYAVSTVVGPYPAYVQRASGGWDIPGTPTTGAWVEDITNAGDLIVNNDDAQNIHHSHLVIGGTVTTVNPMHSGGGVQLAALNAQGDAVGELLHVDDGDSWDLGDAAIRRAAGPLQPLAWAVSAATLDALAGTPGDGWSLHLNEARGISDGTQPIIIANGDNRAFVLRAGNQPPTLALAGPTSGAIGGSVTWNLTVGDDLTAPGSLTLSFVSSDPAIIAGGAISFGGSGSARTATIALDSGLSPGPVTLTFRVSDGAGLQTDAGRTLTLTPAAPSQYAYSTTANDISAAKPPSWEDAQMRDAEMHSSGWVVAMVARLGAGSAGDPGTVMRRSPQTGAWQDIGRPTTAGFDFTVESFEPHINGQGQVTVTRWQTDATHTKEVLAVYNGTSWSVPFPTLTSQVWHVERGGDRFLAGKEVSGQLHPGFWTLGVFTDLYARVGSRQGNLESILGARAMAVVATDVEAGPFWPMYSSTFATPGTSTWSNALPPGGSFNVTQGALISVPVSSHEGAWLTTSGVAYRFQPDDAVRRYVGVYQANADIGGTANLVHLPPLPGDDSLRVVDARADGVVLGSSWLVANDENSGRAVTWTQADGTVDVGALTQGPGSPYALSYPHGITDGGTILAGGSLIVPIPTVTLTGLDIWAEMPGDTISLTATRTGDPAVPLTVTVIPTGFGLGEDTITIPAGQSSASATLTLTTGNGGGSVGLADMAAQADAEHAWRGTATVAIELNAPNPVPLLATVAGNPLNGPFTVTCTFSVPVSGFTLADVTASGASLGGFAGSGASYSWLATPASTAVSMSVAAGTCTATTGGLANVASNSLARTYDNAKPTVTLSAPAQVTGPFTVTATISENVNGFTSGDVTVTNGTVSAFAGSGSNYSWTVTPTASGTVTVAVTANVMSDAAGNLNLAATTVSRTADLLPPTVTLTTTAPAAVKAAFTVTIEFSEVVTGFDLSDLAVVGASKGSLATVTAGKKFTCVLTPAVATEGTITVDVAGAVASDSAGNGNSAAEQLTRRGDTLAPVLTIDCSALANVDGPFEVEVSCNEATDVLDASDLTLTNATAGAFVHDVPGYSWVITINPTANGLVGVGVKTGAVTDLAGNTSAAVSTTITRTFADATLPTVALTTSATDYVKAAFTVTATFSEAPGTSFVLGDITVTNGAASALAGSGLVRTFTVTPSAQGATTVQIAAATFADPNGTDSAVPSNLLSAVFDTVKPTPVLSTAAAPLVNAPFEVVITFPEPVTGLVLADLTATKATLSDFTGVDGDSVYGVTVTPTALGTVTVALAAGKALDRAGNLANAAVTLSRTSDTVRPTVVLASAAPAVTSASPIVITATFSKAMTGFVAGDLAVGNASASLTTTDSKVFTISLTPTADGVVTVQVPADVASDAAGNLNAASAELSRTSDRTAPGITLDSSAPDTVTGAFAVEITASEPVTGLLATDLVVVNGVVTAFTGSGAEYACTIRPTAVGTVQVSIPAAAAVDAAGNVSLATAVLTRDLTVSNDAFADAIAASGWQGTTSGANLNATAETGEPAHAALAAARSVWWTWTAPETGTVTIDTVGSQIDTRLAVYTGAAVNTLSLLAGNDNLSSSVKQSRITGVVTRNTVYRIAVDGKAGAQGLVTLNWSLIADNNVFTKARAISAMSGTDFSGTWGATRDASENLFGGIGAGQTVWWTYTAPADGMLTVDTDGSAIDTVLGVATGTAVNALTVKALDDDVPGDVFAEIGLKVKAGQVYRIMIDASAEAADKNGTVVLNWTLATGGG